MLILFIVTGCQLPQEGLIEKEEEQSVIVEKILGENPSPLKECVFGEDGKKYFSGISCDSPEDCFKISESDLSEAEKNDISCEETQLAPYHDNDGRLIPCNSRSDCIRLCSPRGCEGTILECRENFCQMSAGYIKAIEELPLGTFRQEVREEPEPACQKKQYRLEYDSLEESRNECRSDCNAKCAEEGEAFSRIVVLKTCACVCEKC